MTSSLPSLLALTTSVVLSHVAKICSMPRREVAEGAVLSDISHAEVERESERLALVVGLWLSVRESVVKRSRGWNAEGLPDRSIG
jgi:hypothetical protein